MCVCVCVHMYELYILNFINFIYIFSFRNVMLWRKKHES